MNPSPIYPRDVRGAEDNAVFVARLQKEAAALKSEVEQLRENNALLTKEIDLSEQQKQKVLQEAQQEELQQRAACENYRTLLEESQSSLKIAASEKLRLETSIKDDYVSREDSTKLESQLSKAMEEIDSLKSENATLLAEVNGPNRGMVTQNEDKLHTDEGRIVLEERISALLQREADLKATASERQAECDRLSNAAQQNLADFDKVKSRMEREVSELTASLSTATAENTWLQKTLKEQEDQFTLQCQVAAEEQRKLTTLLDQKTASGISSSADADQAIHDLRVNLENKVTECNEVLVFFSCCLNAYRCVLFS